jgi:DNA-binding MarR family transcriptional regulator
MTLPQLMCLKAVGELEEEAVDEITVAKVAQRVQLSPATVSRIIDRLVLVDVLERTRDDKDRRKVKLSLTTLGLERFQSLPVPLQEEFVNRLRSLEHVERLELLSALKRLSTLMGADDLKVAPILHEGEMMKFDQP